MAKETKVWKILKEAGFEPMEDLTIIVKYAPANLSAKITDFFHMDFYVFQLCKDEIVLVPINQLAMLKKEVALEIPYSTIKSVEVTEDLLNNVITIVTDTDTIRFTAQQKELSDFRSSGILAVQGKGLKLSNWHKENFDATIEALKKLHQPA